MLQRQPELMPIKIKKSLRVRFAFLRVINPYWLRYAQLFFKNRVLKFLIIGLMAIIPLAAVFSLLVIMAFPKEPPMIAIQRLAQIGNINTLLILNLGWAFMVKNKRVPLPRGDWGI